MIDYIKSLYVLGESETDNELKREYRFKANQLAKQCLDDYSSSYLAHKWYEQSFKSQHLIAIIISFELKVRYNNRPNTRL